MSGLSGDERRALEQRVVRAAEAALAARQYVSAIDVLTGMGLVAPSNVEAWRKGHLAVLEEIPELDQAFRLQYASPELSERPLRSERFL